MLEQQEILGLLAIGLGVFAGFILFVPFIWFSYRKQGGLSAGRFALWAAALVYFWAIWTYTLLPLPDPKEMQCAGTNLNPALFMAEIRKAIQESSGNLVSFATQTEVLQLALNVLLFVPLGFFLRLLFKRGWLTALIVGASLSLFIETTQLTGVWGLYPCAYRVFDVNDMMTNTLGAIAGSIVALAMPQGWHHRDAELSPDAPRPVTKPRRLLAMLADFVGFSVISGAIGVAIQAVLILGLEKRDLVLETNISSELAVGITALLWFGLTLATGRTVGDFAVRLKYRSSALPELLARFLRFLGGIGLYSIILLLPQGWASYSTAFAAIAAIFTLLTSRGRGLPGLLSAQDVIDDREDK